MMNQIPPYRMCNAITEKEQKLYIQLWPKMKQKLENKFERPFGLDINFMLYYNPQGLTKNQVLSVISQVFKQYYEQKESK